jgi:hypothetical protein
MKAWPKFILKMFRPAPAVELAVVKRGLPRASGGGVQTNLQVVPAAEAVEETAPSKVTPISELALHRIDITYLTAAGIKTRGWTVQTERTLDQTKQDVLSFIRNGVWWTGPDEHIAGGIVGAEIIPPSMIVTIKVSEAPGSSRKSVPTKE